jgi:hypothetical protein
MTKSLEKMTKKELLAYIQKNIHAEKDLSKEAEKELMKEQAKKPSIKKPAPSKTIEKKISHTDIKKQKRDTVAKAHKTIRKGHDVRAQIYYAMKNKKPDVGDKIKAAIKLARESKARSMKTVQQSITSSQKIYAALNGKKIIPPGKFIVTGSYEAFITFYHGPIGSHIERRDRLLSRTIDLKSSRDMYELAMQCAEADADEVLEYPEHEVTRVENVKVLPLYEKGLKTIPMKGTKLIYSMLGEIAKINKVIGYCVIDYILYQARLDGIKSINRRKLIRALGNNGVTAQHLLQWVKQRSDISLFILDPFLKCFLHHVAPSSTHRMTLTIVMNNEHCYPVTDKQMKKYISSQKEYNLSKVAFNVNFEDYKYINENDTESYSNLYCGELNDKQMFVLKMII